MSILTFTGDSGTGKSTIAEWLKREGFSYVTSTTTRPPRLRENKGEYEFLSVSDFTKADDKGAFLWTANYAGNFYGTRKAYVRTALQEGDYIMILVPEVVPILHEYAALQGLSDRVCSVFVETPSEDILRYRLSTFRGESQDTIDRRLEKLGAWERDARVSGLPYHFISNEGMVRDAVETVLAIYREKVFK